ncbi:DUF1850 domain-containing protein [Oceanisphaera arctica]|uniref:DUF1850 domain-containing protein n=1 Tax=Oceanisphaera arctica TaxID=641510 RepID=A0A2P5TQ57_9GAMM|nr:DUF1850 domain-containing protein [Oceanisphaera arctica]PPL17875.1 hypothetical protein UN63_03210 [Oceanisphaera arctica]GHA23753.1 hypothetical protein GCM10007082_25520 [Oceanisphaera arctica]
MLCLATAVTTVMLLTSSITLSWDHSVEKTHWQEHYQITDNQLHLVEASVQGSGAGMEPPPGARLEQGAWHWQPDIWLEQLTLASSEFTGDYTLCLDSGLCRPLGHWLLSGHKVTLIPCDAPEVN